MTDMYEMFETDPDLERNGVIIDYGSFRVTLARAGGANKLYAKVLERESRPYRRAMETETIDPEVALEVMQRVAAQSLITNWETKVGEGDDATWKKGILPPKDPETGKRPDKLLPIKPETLMATFKRLPDIYHDLDKQAKRMSLYRKAVLEVDAKN